MKALHGSRTPRLSKVHLPNGCVGLRLASSRRTTQRTPIMPHRVYTDASGRQWNVWSVQPEYAERRRPTAPDAAALPPGRERRAKKGFRVPLGRTWTEGWLVFETTSEKRRLAPYPANWTEL